MNKMKNPKGNYFFLSGIAPFSSGVVSMEGYEVVQVIIRTPPPYQKGFQFIDQHLKAIDRPKHALCAVQLRIPKPLSFEGFAEFNEGYLDILRDWDLLVDGINPVARTNVAPEVRPPEEPVLYGFSYTVSTDVKNPPSTFVIAGAGESKEGTLSPDSLIRKGEISPGAMREKVKFVMGTMHTRLSELQLKWSDVTAVNIYTVHPLHHLLDSELLNPMEEASRHSLRWYFSRPPIKDLEFEMDLRGVQKEIWL